MRPDTCHAPGADLALPCLASLLELQDVASLGSQTSGLGPQNRNWVLLKILTDEDIVGLGERTYGTPEGAFEGLRRRLIGSDPLNLNRLHYSGQPERGLWQMGGLGAGVEIALWDIMGKKLGVPLWQLLGGKLRNRIRMYCDCYGGDCCTLAHRYADVGLNITTEVRADSLFPVVPLNRALKSIFSFSLDQAYDEEFELPLVSW